MSNNSTDAPRRRPRRRNALRRQVVAIKGHRFVLNYFKSFTFCGHCTRFLWGVTGPQGYKCLDCDFSIHDRCLEYVSFNCPGTSTPIGEHNPHHFKSTTYHKPTWCEHCGTMLYGIIHQGKQCTDCGLNVHYRCTKQVPKNCGHGTVGEPNGRMKLIFSSERIEDTYCRINIKVCECRNLPSVTTGGKADPYVILTLPYSDSTTVQQKTEKRESTLNPDFKEDFFFDIPDSEMESRINLAVWHWNKITPNEFIGGMSMKVGEVLDLTKDEPFTSWFKLLNEKLSKFTNERIVVDGNEAAKLIAAYNRHTVEDKRNRYASVRQLRRGITIESLSKQNLPEVTLDDFTLLQVLGKGSFGKVFLAEHRGTKDVYAVKSMKKDVIVKEDDVEGVLNERQVLSLQKKPPFLTGLHSSFQTKDHLFLVMEYVSGGDLMFHIGELGRFSEVETKFYAAEIILGLLYLHKAGIIYRDLKLDNVMLDADGHIKIADFGLCKTGIMGGTRTNTFCGTPDYIAPEVLQNVAYNGSVDWWALGVLIYEMLVGRAPFDHGDKDDDFDFLFNNILESIVVYPKALTEPAKNIIKGFLTKYPSRRLGCHPTRGENDIKTHSFFRGLDWDKLANKEVRPPYKPKIKDKTSVENFDPEFTKEPVQLSLVEARVVEAIEPEVFEGFTFTNPEYYVPS